jgi:hypothetical protein
MAEDSKCRAHDVAGGMTRVVRGHAPWLYWTAFVVSVLSLTEYVTRLLMSSWWRSWKVRMDCHTAAHGAFWHSEPPGVRREA